MNLVVFILLVIQATYTYGFSVYAPEDCADTTFGDCTISQDTLHKKDQGSYETDILNYLDVSTVLANSNMNSSQKYYFMEELKVSTRKCKATEDVIDKLRFKRPFIRSTEVTNRLGRDSRLLDALQETVERVGAGEAMKNHISQYFEKSAKEGGGVSTLQVQPVPQVSCNSNLRYRRIDGKCNNLGDKHRGSANIPLKRYMDNRYEDGVSIPRGGLTSSSLPSARVVSRKIHHAADPNPLTTKGITLMAMQFGQFLDHDITMTADMGCPSGWTFLTTGCYKLTNVGTHQEAVDNCKKDGGYLVEIDSQEENNALYPYYNEVAWLGATDIEREGEWVWSHSGRKVSFTNWQGGEPNGWTRENCLAFTLWHTGEWNDAACGWKLKGVCELDRDCPVGYTAKSGDVPGWGSLEGSIAVSSREDCAKLCDQRIECHSFEHSFEHTYTSSICNLNKEKNPTSPLYYWYQQFCSKQEARPISRADGSNL